MRDFEDELDEIRIALHEETKGMKEIDIINKMNNDAREILKKHGMDIIKNPFENSFTVKNKQNRQFYSISRF